MGTAVTTDQDSGRTTFQVETLPDKGFERFATISVVATDSPVNGEWRLHLDSVARRRLKVALGKRSYSAVRGHASISWKSDEDRHRCVEYQSGRPGRNGKSRRNGKRSRWDDVLDDAARLGAGELPPSGPVFLHPSVTGLPSDILRPIDGARRIMSAIEAGLKVIEVVIVRLSMSNS